MSVTSRLNGQSTVSFCEYRLVPREANRVMKLYEKDCLAENKRGVYIDLVVQGLYNEALGAVWRDKDNRLDFLRIVEPGFHAPLMFERVVAELTANPTIDTICRICLPLLRAAAFRVVQDSKCSTDNSVHNGDAGTRMSMTYEASLAKKIESLSKKDGTELYGKSLKSIYEENKDLIVRGRQKAVLETANATLTASLSSPDWIGKHGMNMFLEGKISMYPLSEYKSIRDAYAESVIKRFADAGITA